MTLIVFNKGILASDSRETADGSVTDERSKKIYRHKQFTLAATGASSDCAWFYEWLRSDFKNSPPSSAFDASEALLIDSKKRKVYKAYMNGSMEELSAKHPHVIGTEQTAGLILATEMNMQPRDIIKMIAKYTGYVNSRIQQVKCW